MATTIQPANVPQATFNPAPARGGIDAASSAVVLSTIPFTGLTSTQNNATTIDPNSGLTVYVNPNATPASLIAAGITAALDPLPNATETDAVTAQNETNLAAATSTGQAMQDTLNAQLAEEQADEANAEITAGVNSEAQAPFEKILIGLGLATLLAAIFL